MQELFEDKEFIAVTDIADVMGLTPQTVRRYFESKKIPGIKIGKSWVVPRVVFIQYLYDKLAQNTIPDSGTALDASEMVLLGFPIHFYQENHDFAPIAIG